MNSRVSIWQRAAVLGLITAFVTAGLLRLNDCDLFNPDSPRYVIYSQSIVNLGEYRATDLPGTPLYSWRPPGLSLLLAPVLAMRPYDVVAAKGVVLLTGALLLWAVFRLTSLQSGGWSALVVASFIASGPTFLVLSTEVLTEVPFTLGVLVVLLILSRSTEEEVGDAVGKRGWSRFTTMGIAIAALAFTPWLRTAGVALVAAVGIWSVMSRARLRWLSAVIVAMAGLGALAWRNKQAAGENYVGSLFARLRERGPGSMITSGLDSVWFYFSAAPGLLLPGLAAERPSYAPLTLNPLPTLDLVPAVPAGLAAMLLLLGMLGMWKRRALGGSLMLLYLVVYCACLIVWPWRHDRFLWPLVPVVMSSIPAGLSAIAGKFPFAERLVSAFGAILMLVLCGWQAITCGQLVAVNREFVNDRSEFHTSRVPGFYFSNWRRAGTWLNAHTPPHARVLTWHAAVGGTSHRFQKRVQFETMTPEKLRREIEAFLARYLVVPGGQFGDGFGWRQLAADPALQLNIVYNEQDVTVLEIIPNRTGEVSKSAYSNWLERQMPLIDDARTRMPRRIDLAIRHASLLRECGRDADAIRILRELVGQGVVTVRVYAELGWLLFDAEEFADAANFLDLARTMPNAESVAGVLADGAGRARERLSERASGIDRRSIEGRLRRVKALVGGLKYAAAESEADQILAEAPLHPETLFVRGHLHHLLGELSQAESRYEQALQLGVADASQFLLLIRIGAAMAYDSTSIIDGGDHQETIDPNDPNAYIRLAKMLRDRGWPGRALEALEKAHERFPAQPSIEQPLADLYRHFARPELAVPLYQSILASNHNDEAARQGLEAARWGLREPDMSPK